MTETKWTWILRRYGAVIIDPFLWRYDNNFLEYKLTKGEFLYRYRNAIRTKNFELFYKNGIDVS